MTVAGTGSALPPNPLRAGERVARIESSLATEWSRLGIQVLRLHPNRTVVEELGLDLHLLVPRPRAAEARTVLESAGWRYELGNHGPWRLTVTTSYGWDDGTVLHLHSGLPSAPLPARALRRLENRLWREARQTPQGLMDPRSEPLAVFLAVQAMRPGFAPARDTWRRAFSAHASSVQDWSEAVALAREAGVGGALRRALAAIPEAHRPSLPEPPDGFREKVWAASCRLQRMVRPRRLQAPLKALLGGTPLLDRSTARTRFAGVELLAGPKVFVPRACSEALVTAALEQLHDRLPQVVADVGTGCGAVALALASSRRDLEVYGTDTSRRAVRWARLNARRSNLPMVRFTRGSLLEPLGADLRGRIDVVVGNVPYVPPALNHAGWGDAPGAIGGTGRDGLGLQRDLADQARVFLRPGGSLVLQLFADQVDPVVAELVRCGYRPGPRTACSDPNVVITAQLPPKSH